MHIGREHTLSEEHAGGAACGGGHHTLEGGGVGLGRACVRGGCAAVGEGRDARGVQGGQARTVTSAKSPLGAIATPMGRMNWALVPELPSLKPVTPLPASVVVAPVVLPLNLRRPRIPSCVMNREARGPGGYTG